MTTLDRRQYVVTTLMYMGIVGLAFWLFHLLTTHRFDEGSYWSRFGEGLAASGMLIAVLVGVGLFVGGILWLAWHDKMTGWSPFLIAGGGLLLLIAVGVIGFGWITVSWMVIWPLLLFGLALATALTLVVVMHWQIANSSTNDERELQRRRRERQRSRSTERRRNA